MSKVDSLCLTKNRHKLNEIVLLRGHEMEYLFLVMSLISTVALFLTSLIFNIGRNIKGIKFMALALLNSAVSCGLLLFYGGDHIQTSQITDLKAAILVFAGLSALFYKSYCLAKSKNDKK